MYFILAVKLFVKDLFRCPKKHAMNERQVIIAGNVLIVARDKVHVPQVLVTHLKSGSNDLLTRRVVVSGIK
jgi:hypothetical protein